MAVVLTPERTRVAALRDELAYMGCGLWMIVGLYVDGWSHQADKPETFFTPWHFLLYSGFGAAVVYSGWIAVRDGRAGREPAMADDRVTTLGVVLFVVGAIGDGIWHSVIGIEVDIEGLISPTHVALMTGGLLMVTLPIRSALRRNDEEAPLAVLASAALALGVIAFFLMYLMPWDASYAFEVAYVPDTDVGDLYAVTGMASVMVSAALFTGTVLWLAQRWRVRFGTATVTYTAVAFGVAALDGFDVRLSVLAGTAAGLVVDVLLAAKRPLPVVGLAGGGTLIAAFLGLHHLEHGVEWGPSLWAGAIVFGLLSGYATGLAVTQRSSASAAHGR